MQEIQEAGTDAIAKRNQAGDLIVSSRRHAFETLRNEVAIDGSGPVLLTGEPGTGKTWLWHRLVRELPPRWRWVSVEMSEAMDSRDFFGLIGHGLGISTGDRMAAARLIVVQALAEEAAEGRSWLLVIENAQNTPGEVWSEIEALAHVMEESAGFGSLILVGTTDLTRLLAVRSRRAIASRLATHVHLLPLDLEESRELAASAWGTHVRTEPPSKSCTAMQAATRAGSSSSCEDGPRPGRQQRRDRQSQSRRNDRNFWFRNLSQLLLGPWTRSLPPPPRGPL